MKLAIIILLKFVLFTNISFAEIGFVNPKKENKYSVDVCIYGGTSAGVIAAYTARKCGKTVLLIEPGKMLGRMTTGGLGQTDIGNKQAITGLKWPFYRKIGKEYGVAEQWTFESRVALKVMMDYVNSENINVLYQSRLLKVKKESSTIKYIVIKDDTDENGGTIKISAIQLIDCTYEGELMAKAG